MRKHTRTTAALITGLALTGGMLFGGAAAQAAPQAASGVQTTTTADPINQTFAFKVAGKRYTLQRKSYGTDTRTVAYGTGSVVLPVHFHIVFRDNHHRVISSVDRTLYKSDYIIDRFDNDQRYTSRSFASAKHRVLQVKNTTAKAGFERNLREASAGYDLTATIGNVYTYLAQLPADQAPDYTQVKTVKSTNYTGSVKVTGTNRTNWQVVVRDTQDHYGVKYDERTGKQTSFKL